MNVVQCIISRYSVHNEKFHVGWLVGWLEFNVPHQHKYGYVRDEEKASCSFVPLVVADPGDATDVWNSIWQ